MIRAVLFDLDDTLFDHRHGARQALAAVCERHTELAVMDPAELGERHAEILEALHLCVLRGEMGLDAARHERFRRLFECAGATADALRVQQAASMYRECYVQSWREVPGARELLCALATRARLAVVSNGTSAEQREKLRYCGFDAYLHTIVVSEEVGAWKPDPAIFRVALERVGASAADAVMVGDAWSTDVAGARAAGVPAVWFNRAGVPRPEAWPEVREIRALQPAAAVAARICEIREV